jgi:kynurenine formamidase
MGTMLQALETWLAQSRIVDLAQPMKQGMPSFFAHVPFSFSLNIRHVDMELPGGLGMANDVIVGCTHSGTHIDAVGHFAKDGCLHGGIDVRQAVTGNSGLMKHGIEQTPPIVRRGVLLDVAAFKGRDTLDPGYAITGDDLENTAKAQGVKVQKGDVVLIRTGWGSMWNTPAKYQGPNGIPGPNLSAAQWLVRNGTSLTGSDTMTYEVSGENGGAVVHGFLLAEQAVQIIENMDLEELAKVRTYAFMFFAAALKIVGATGSPIRPIAIC